MTDEPFYIATRWRHEGASRQAYQNTQDFIALSGLALSAFRFQIAPEVDYIVVVVGEHPGDEMAGECLKVMSLGSKLHVHVTSLAPDVLNALLARRDQLRTTGGGWVEGHYGPGLEVPYDR